MEIFWIFGIFEEKKSKLFNQICYLVSCWIITFCTPTVVQQQFVGEMDKFVTFQGQVFFRMLYVYQTLLKSVDFSHS